MPWPPASWRGAGLDHFEGEALPAGHPLLSMGNVVLTPHIGGATVDTEARGGQMVADDLGASVGRGAARCTSSTLRS